jgi:hypothetical protein
MQECPAADLAIAALAGAVARALFSGIWSSLDAQRALETGRLAGILGQCILDADQAVIEDARYLAALGVPLDRCDAQEVWQRLFEACRADPLLDDGARATLDFILERGPLARRRLRATGRAFDRARLATVYRKLCDCLAEGRLFEGVP